MHPSRPAIQLSTYTLLIPSLFLTYLGQGAYLIHAPQDVRHDADACLRHTRAHAWLPVPLKYTVTHSMADQQTWPSTASFCVQADLCASIAAHLARHVLVVVHFQSLSASLSATVLRQLCMCCTWSLAGWQVTVNAVYAHHGDLGACHIFSW